MLKDVDAAQDLDGLYPVLADNCYSAGWHRRKRSLWETPASAYQPRRWRFAEARAALEKAGDWISTDLAERRNLLMFNPVEDNEYASLNTLVAAYQMIKPGEHARAHRHTPNALRLVLEAGDDLFTVVDGVKLPMRPGDVLLTPGGAWHSHFSDAPDTGKTGYWIDVLDVPLVHLLEPMFFEPLPGGVQTITSEPNAHPYRIPFDTLRADLEGATPTPDGARRYVLPQGKALTTMELAWISVAGGGKFGPRKHTASTLYAATQGSGRYIANDRDMTIEPGDVFVAPSWTAHSIEAESDLTLFEVSDAPVLRATGFYIEGPSGPWG